ncbi:MAG: Circadian clock protein KaiB [Planctomycetes bacterium ADurb.Bin401]|nr:MAG: Circadian clock protein KaiB [Planctomycetes bacterium ADurb.Bin401]
MEKKMDENNRRMSSIERDLIKKSKEADKSKQFVLRLYIAGMTAQSSKAIKNITQICEDNLKGRYDLQIIDIYQQPALAKGEQIIAAPTLIKKLPLPLRKFIGNMANKEKILVGLDIQPKD